MIRFLISAIACFLLTDPTCVAQVQAKAISYELQVDLEIFAPDYVNDTESEDLECIFEVDMYYTYDSAKTVVRTMVIPSDYNLTIRQRLYAIRSKDEYNVDHNQKYALLRKNQLVKITPTKNKKTILGYPCKEYRFEDFRGVEITAWVTEKLPKNLCPAGNFGLPGTALEIVLSNGLHYRATDFGEGELNKDFFKIPADYKQEVIPADGK